MTAIATTTHNRVSTRTTNGTPRTSSPTRVGVDDDVLYAIVHYLDGIARKLSPRVRLALAQRVLVDRVRESYRLARMADDPEDRLLQSLWQANRPHVVHLAVGPITSAADEARAYLACGSAANGVSMRDARWKR